MNSIINGTDGSDTLSGEAGDTLVGGRGDDVFYIYDTTTRVQDYFDAGRGGYDRIFTAVSYDMQNASVEFLSTITHADTTPVNLIGNGYQDTIIGNYGNNIITSGGGSTTLIGLRGDDTYYVREGNRVVENAGEGFDTVYTSTSFALDAASSIEVLSAFQAFAGVSALNLTGNAVSQTIIGSNGANIIDGRGGNDTLIGLNGDDTYRVYGSGDVVVEGVNGGNDTVFTSGNFYLGAGVSIETISAADQASASSLYLLGNALDQRMIGDYGNNTLNGGGSRGGDTLVGLLGDDIYRIFGQNDVVLESAGQGNDIIYTSGNYRLAAGVEVETLSTHSHVSTLAMNLTGNELNNTIIGNYGTNILDGGGGSDTLIGLEGDDVFRFTAAPAAGAVTTIRDYGTGNDVILLDSTVFTALADGGLPTAALAYGAAAADADDRIIYNAATGALSYDADGNGAGAAIQFAELSAGIAQNALRIVVATVPPEQFVTNTPGTYLIGNAIGTGTVIPDSVTSVTFNRYGIGYLVDLVFGASTSDAVLPSIRANSADLLGTLDFSQLLQGIVTRPTEGYTNAAGVQLLAEPPAPTGTAPFPSMIIGTAFDDIVDRFRPGAFGVGTVRAGAGNDYIRGAGVADGGAGNDRLIATINTMLTGGSGADVFDLPIYTRQPGTNSWSAANTITDFNPAEDKINIVLNYGGGIVPVDLKAGSLSAAQFVAGTAATSAEQRIFYNTETGELSFLTRGNPGSFSGEIPLFAKLPAHLDLTADNFTIILP